MECLKLIAQNNSNSYAEKRTSRLMSLLDESQEILMLLTNSLKVDLNSKNDCGSDGPGHACQPLQHGDGAGPLHGCAEAHATRSHPIQEKAVVCAVRLIQKCPELAVEFKDEALALLDLKNNCIVGLHGTMLPGWRSAHDRRPLLVR